MKYTFESDSELIVFINENVITTMEVAALLNCSRQNIDDLVRRGKLTPIRKTQRDKWFLKSDILARLEK